MHITHVCIHLLFLGCMSSSCTQLRPPLLSHCYQWGGGVHRAGRRNREGKGSSQGVENSESKALLVPCDQTQKDPSLFRDTPTEKTGHM